MSSQLLAALSGAIVGFIGTFVGTWLLQRRQFHRQDLEALRMRYGIVKALRAELMESGLLVDGVIKRGGIPRGINFPTAAWESQGHLLIAAVIEPAEFALIEAFGRLRGMNGLIAAISGPSLPVNPEMGMEKLKKAIDTAIGYLNTLCDEYRIRELAARRKPWERWRRMKKDGSATDGEARKRPPVDGPLITS